MEFQEIKIAVCDDHQEMNQIMSEIIHNVMDGKSIAYRVLGKR